MLWPALFKRLLLNLTGNRNNLIFLKTWLDLFIAVSLGPCMGCGTQDALRKYLLIDWMNEWITGLLWLFKVAGWLIEKGYSHCTTSTCRTRIQSPETTLGLQSWSNRVFLSKALQCLSNAEERENGRASREIMIQRWGLEERKWKAEGGDVDRKFLWEFMGGSVARNFI